MCSHFIEVFDFEHPLSKYGQFSGASLYFSICIFGGVSHDNRNEMSIGSIQRVICMAVMVGLFAMPAVQAQSIFDKVKKAVKDTQEDDAGEDKKKSNVDLTGISTGEMSGALKEALNIGVKEGIQKLGAEDGFFKNELVKILLPEKLRKVDATLRGIGLGNLADQGLLLLNRAAED